MFQYIRCAYFLNTQLLCHPVRHIPVEPMGLMGVGIVTTPDIAIVDLHQTCLRYAMEICVQDVRVSEDNRSTGSEQPLYSTVIVRATGTGYRPQYCWRKP